MLFIFLSLVLFLFFFYTTCGCLQWTKEDGLRQAAVANQFIPMNTNPKEVLEMRNKVSHSFPSHQRQPGETRRLSFLKCLVFFRRRSGSRTCRTLRRRAPSPRFCVPAPWSAPSTRSVCVWSPPSRPLLSWPGHECLSNRLEHAVPSIFFSFNIGKNEFF